MMRLVVTNGTAKRDRWLWRGVRWATAKLNSRADRILARRAPAVDPRFASLIVGGEWNTVRMTKVMSESLPGTWRSADRPPRLYDDTPLGPATADARATTTRVMIKCAGQCGRTDRPRDMTLACQVQIARAQTGWRWCRVRACATSAASTARFPPRPHQGHRRVQRRVPPDGHTRFSSSVPCMAPG